MEDISFFAGNFYSRSFYVAAIASSFCFLFALWIVRSQLASILREVRSNKSGIVGNSSKRKNCECICSCSGTFGDSITAGATSTSYANGSAGEMYERTVAVVERQSGASIMEQLVPEITTHALSYLDYSSLCRLSMTNSSMRRAANDDNAWKALYHKDFTVEQDSVTPHNGWKAYYAATRAVMNINGEFYKIIRERSLSAMSRLWLHSDYVKCAHASGALFSGYDAVMESWQLMFDLGIAYQVGDVRVRVLRDMAWVTMKTFIHMEARPFNVTNVYEFQCGQWYMVHHHSSVMLTDGDLENENLFV